MSQIILISNLTQLCGILLKVGDRITFFPCPSALTTHLPLPQHHIISHISLHAPSFFLKITPSSHSNYDDTRHICFHAHRNLNKMEAVAIQYRNKGHIINKKDSFSPKNFNTTTFYKAITIISGEQCGTRERDFKSRRQFQPTISTLRHLRISKSKSRRLVDNEMSE